MAEGGTIFLDEIGEMDLGFQSKLLRVVETGTFYRVGGTKPVKVDFRIISATNRDLLKEVNEGRFRADLYYRLQGFDIRIPPLRERKEDIPFLVEHFLGSRRGTSAKITPEALECLIAMPWPGNIRELFNVLEKALIMAQGEPITPDHLPLEIVQACMPDKATPQKPEPDGVRFPPTMPLAEVEKAYILQVFEHEGEHQGRTAAVLGISTRTLHRKLKEYGRI